MRSRIAIGLVGVATCAWLIASKLHEEPLVAPSETRGAAKSPTIVIPVRGASAEVAAANDGGSNTAESVQVAQRAEGKNAIVASVWAAPDAGRGLSIAQNADVNVEEFADYLYYVRGSCRGAMRVLGDNTETSKKEQTSTDAEDKATKRLYFQRYCGEFSRLNPQFDAVIESFESKKMEEIHALSGAIITASEHSQAAAAATIDEIAVTRNPQYATSVAWHLIPATAPGGPLESWRSLLPGGLTETERVAIFGNAGERVACLNAPDSCAAYTPWTMIVCSGLCRRDEDLLSFRRRTTSPMLFEASERIAAEMLRRRAN